MNTLLDEVRDQSLHVLYAVCLMLAFIYPVHWLVAILLTMIVAIERELEQHNWVSVGKMDLAFWFVGCCGVAVVYNGLKYVANPSEITETFRSWIGFLGFK